jgi:shikimate 5-dehydrogenase
VRSSRSTSAPGSGGRSRAVAPVAKEAGARLVILNAEPTEMDELADAVLRGSISELLSRLVGMGG